MAKSKFLRGCCEQKPLPSNKERNASEVKVLHSDTIENLIKKINDSSLLQNYTNTQLQDEMIYKNRILNNYINNRDKWVSLPKEDKDLLGCTTCDTPSNNIGICVAGGCLELTKRSVQWTKTIHYGKKTNQSNESNNESSSRSFGSGGRY